MTAEPGMRILFVNHTGANSGAENAMIRLLKALPAEHARAVACPPNGPLKQRLQAMGFEQHDLPGTDASFALDPVETPRSLLALLRSARSLRRSARAYGTDVIHANSTRAGLIAVVARAMGGPPVVVQSHDHMPEGRLGELVRRVLARGAAVVVAVTDRTAAEFNKGLKKPVAERVYISIDHERFSTAVEAAPVRAELGLTGDVPLLIQVAQITPWKGQDTAIRALAGVRECLDAHLLIVGEVAFASQRYDNDGFRASLIALAEELGVSHAVHFLGQRDDVPALMRACDLFMLPSWDEPFGLVVAEAMAVGTPVLVTSKGGVCEYVRDGENGHLLDPHVPEQWVVAALALLPDPTLRASMAADCVRTASGFTDERYAAGMLEVYRRATR